MDELYDYDSRVPKTDEPMRYVTNEFEPVFDAADFVRCGRDLFFIRSNVTNATGIEWLRRHLGEKYRIHEIETRCRTPMHIDSSFMPLAPGKVLVNPDYIDVDRLPKILKSWDVLVAPRPDPIAGFVKSMSMCSAWISMNVLMLDEERVIVEKNQPSMIQALKNWGFKPIPCSFLSYAPMGGAFHCAIPGREEARHFAILFLARKRTAHAMKHLTGSPLAVGHGPAGGLSSTGPISRGVAVAQGDRNLGHGDDSSRPLHRVAGAGAVLASDPTLVPAGISMVLLALESAHGGRGAQQPHAAGLGRRGTGVKVALLKQRHGISYQETTAALVLQLTVQNIGLIPFVLIRCLLMLGIDGLPPASASAAGAALAIFSACMALFFLLQRRKVFSPLGGWFTRGRQLAVLDHVHEFEERLIAFYSGRRRRFFLAVALELGIWVLSVAGVWCAIYSLGHPVGWMDAWVMAAVVALVHATLFFVLANIGTQEAAFVLLGAAITGSAALGLAVARWL